MPQIPSGNPSATDKEEPVLRNISSEPGDGEQDQVGPAELRARIAQLREENDRLRKQYSNVRKSEYRRTAIALGVVGVGTVTTGWLFPASRRVLFAFGITAIFGSILLFFLTPERFIPARVGDQVQKALATNQSRLVSELGLSDIRLYVPRTGSSLQNIQSADRLFIPREQEYELPADDTLDSLFVITNNGASRGVSLHPSASGLVSEFETSLTAGLSESPVDLATQLADGLVDGLELADEVTSTVNQDRTQVVFGISGSAFGSINRFDDPLQSFLGLGLARGLGTPVRVEVSEPTENWVDGVVTCHWDLNGPD